MWSTISREDTAYLAPSNTQHRSLMIVRRLSQTLPIGTDLVDPDLVWILVLLVNCQDLVAHIGRIVPAGDSEVVGLRGPRQAGHRVSRRIEHLDVLGICLGAGRGPCRRRCPVVEERHGSCMSMKPHATHIPCSLFEVGCPPRLRRRDAK